MSTIQSRWVLLHNYHVVCTVVVYWLCYPRVFLRLCVYLAPFFDKGLPPSEFLSVAPIQ